MDGQEKVVTAMEDYDWALMGTGRRPGAIFPASSLMHGSIVLNSNATAGLVLGAENPPGNVW